MEIIIPACRFFVGRPWNIIRDDFSLYSFEHGVVLRHLGLGFMCGAVTCRTKIYIGVHRLFPVFSSTNVFLILGFRYRRKRALWHIRDDTA